MWNFRRNIYKKRKRFKEDEIKVEKRAIGENLNVI